MAINKKKSRKDVIIVTPLPRDCITSLPRDCIAWRGKSQSNNVINEKIDTVHNNPVEAGLVFRAEVGGTAFTRVTQKRR